MVLVEDGGDLLSILADGQQCLLVVVGGDVELKTLQCRDLLKQYIQRKYTLTSYHARFNYLE